MSKKKKDTKNSRRNVQLIASKNTPKAFSTEQLTELIHLSKTGPYGIRNHCMIVLLAKTGLRINELCHLKISNYDYDNQIIKVGFSEPSIRKIPVSASVGEIINTYINFTFGCHINELPNSKFKDFYLFPRRSENTPISPRQIQFLITNLIEKAKTIPEEEKYIGGDQFFKRAYRSSSFRKTFILNLLQEEQPFPTISYLTGITSTSTLKYYLEKKKIE